MATRTIQLTVVFEVAEEGGYVARVPSLPGCVTQGETLEEAEEMVKDAIKAYFASLKKHGDATPFGIKEVVETVSLSVPA
ncbi:MAG: type II toxin-antitoxin system HicB family antitoxin [Elusimicrobiota bacterium]